MTWPKLSNQRFIFLAAILVVVLVVGTLNSTPASAAQQVQLTGTLTIVRGDPGPESFVQNHQDNAYLIDAQGNSIQLLVDLVKVQPLVGQRVVIEGSRTTAGRTALNPSTPAIQVGSIRATDGANSANSSPSVVSGSQKWVNIACRFSDSISTTPKAVSYFSGMVSNTYPGLDHFWREQSYNMVNIAGSYTVTTWYNLPQPRAYYIVNNTADLSKLANDCTAAADGEVNYPTYVGINMMFNQNLDCCAWGGSWFLTRDGQSKSYRMTWMPPWGYKDQSVLAHEMGHGFGLPHSSGPYGATYDSNWDVMSWGGRNCANSDATYGCVGTGTIAYHHDSLGWIPAQRIFNSARGTRTLVTIEKLDLPQATTDYLMAKIPIPNSNPARYYTVESRVKGSYDTAVPYTSVIIEEVDPTRIEPAHVMDPDANGNPNDAGAAFTQGETFTDAANQISVSVVATNATSFTLIISNGASAGDTIGAFLNGTWYLRSTNTAGAADITLNYGSAGHLPVVGDWNGDGGDTVGIYDTTTGIFQLRDTNTTGGPDYVFVLGNPGDRPVAGRWDNTMTHDGAGVYRDSNGILYLKRTLSTGFSDYYMVLGNPGDQGIAGDWNGDGYDSVGIYRASNNHIYLSNVNGNGITFSDIDFAFGNPSGKAMAGDWTGSGISRGGYYLGGSYYLRNALTDGGADTTFAFGPAGALPVAGKWLAGSAAPPPMVSAPLNILVTGNPAATPSTDASNSGGLD